ncbi:hypothetical protein QJQ45_017903 [Haematococcus lacustris]|nr:hypothetical protein QJQ45_017903 [Haematococcus lacustris]
MKLPTKGKEYPALSYKWLQDRAAKAQEQHTPMTQKSEKGRAAKHRDGLSSVSHHNHPLSLIPLKASNDRSVGMAGPRADVRCRPRLMCPRTVCVPAFCLGLSKWQLCLVMQVIKVPEGAVLRGCKQTRRKLREHLRLRAEIHSQLRVIASLLVLRIFLTCLVGYPTPGFPSAPQPPAVQPPQPPDDSEPESQSDSESESEPEPVRQPPQRRCSARLAALAPAAPTGPPMPLDCEDPAMLRQLKDFCKFFANPNFKTIYNQLQRRLVRHRHPMLMPAFEDPSNQALLARRRCRSWAASTWRRFVKLYAKAARAKLGWSGEEAQLFIKMACGYGINAHSSELKAATLDKGHVADLIEGANKHRRLLGMKKQGSLQDTLPLPCRMRHAVHVCRWLEQWQQPHTPPVPGQPKRGKRRKGIGETREFLFDPDTQIGVGIDPGVTQAVSAASGHRSSPTSASSAGTSLEANLKHITVTLATWDAVWEMYLDPKWSRQRLRLYGSQDRALEQFFGKLEEEVAEVSMERHGHAKQLVVFFGAATIGTGGGWGADAVLRACCKVVCRPRGAGQRRGRVVLVDEHHTSRVRSAVNGQQPCEEELDKLSATRPAGWKPPAGQVEPRLVRPAWSQERGQPVRGLMWCPVVPPRKPPQAPRSSQEATQPAASEPGPSTPQLAKRSKRTKAEPAAEPTMGKAAKAKPAPQPGRWLDRDCNAVLNMQRIGESRWRPLELCYWPDQGALPAKGKEYPGLGYKRLRDQPPKAQQQQQQPADAQTPTLKAKCQACRGSCEQLGVAVPRQVPSLPSQDQTTRIDCGSGSGCGGGGGLGGLPLCGGAGEDEGQGGRQRRGAEATDHNEVDLQAWEAAEEEEAPCSHDTVLDNVGKERKKRWCPTGPLETTLMWLAADIILGFVAWLLKLAKRKERSNGRPQPNTQTLPETREFLFDPDTQIGVGIDPGVTQAVSAASGVWDPQSGQLMANQLRRWKLTKGQVKHASGLNNARRDTERWLAPIKPHLQHLAAASPAGTSLEANLKHITVTLATWDAVWEVYLDPKWSWQRLRLYGAQDRVLEQFFNKLEEEVAEVSMERHGHAKQLVVFFGAATIGTGGGWGADAVLRACCKVVCRPRGAGQRRGRVVLVDEHRTSRVSSAVNGQQPCEEELDKLMAPRKPPQAPRSSQAATQPAASEPGPSTPPPAKRSKPAAEPTQPTKGKGKGKAAKAKPAPQPGRWLDRDCNAALNMQRIGESKWRPLELCYWPDQGALPAKGKEYPGLGYKRRRDQPPKAQQQQQQQPAEAQTPTLKAKCQACRGSCEQLGVAVPRQVPSLPSQDQTTRIDCGSGSGCGGGGGLGGLPLCGGAGEDEGQGGRQRRGAEATDHNEVDLQAWEAAEEEEAPCSHDTVLDNVGKERKKRWCPTGPLETTLMWLAADIILGFVAWLLKLAKRKERSNGRPQPNTQTLPETREFLFDPDTQIGVGIDPGVTQAVSAASGVWDPQSGQLMANQLRRWKLTKGQVKHASGLNNARRDTERWLAPIKPHLQHLAAASPAGTSLEANLKHITVTLATWDAVWEVYLDPKWSWQRLRLYGAQDRVLEQFFNKLEEEVAEVSMERHGHAKQLVVFFGAATIGTGGGWGADAVLRACCKVVCRPRGAGQRRGRVVLVDEHRTSRVSSAVNGQQPCEEELDKLMAPRKPPQAPRSSQAATQPAASEPGPSTPPPAKRSKPAAEPTQPTKGKGKGKAAKAKPAPQPGRWLDRDCNAALNMQRIGESKWRPLELCYWPDQGALPAKGKEYPGLGYKRRRDQPPKAQQQQQQQPAEAQTPTLKAKCQACRGSCEQLGVAVPRQVPSLPSQDQTTRIDCGSGSGCGGGGGLGGLPLCGGAGEDEGQGGRQRRGAEATDHNEVDLQGWEAAEEEEAPCSHDTVLDNVGKERKKRWCPTGPLETTLMWLAADIILGFVAWLLKLAKRKERSNGRPQPNTQTLRGLRFGLYLGTQVAKAVSAASGVWDPQSGQLMANQLRRWKLTKGQVKHASGLNNARRDTERWLAPIKPHLQHLAAASSAGTSLQANLKHITVTLATWDAVWEVYLDPKWSWQRLRLYGAQDRVLEQFFNKLEEEVAEVSMERHGHAKQLVVFFGAATIGTGGGWGADAVLRACCKVVCRPRGAGQRRGRVVLVDEHRTSRVSSAVNGQQPCEEELDKLSATRPAGWKPPAGQVEPRLVRPAWSQERGQPVRGLMWCPVVAPRKPPQAPRSSQAATQPAASEPGPSTPPPAKRSKPAAEPTQPTKGKGKGKAAKAKPAPQPGRWLDRDCNAALNMQRIGESKWRPLELCYWPDQGALPAKGKEYPGLGYKRLRDQPPKAQQQQQQQPAEAQTPTLKAKCQACRGSCEQLGVAVPRQVPSLPSQDQTTRIDCGSGSGCGGGGGLGGLPLCGGAGEDEGQGGRQRRGAEATDHNEVDLQGWEAAEEEEAPCSHDTVLDNVGKERKKRWCPTGPLETTLMWLAADIILGFVAWLLKLAKRKERSNGRPQPNTQTLRGLRFGLYLGTQVAKVLLWRP